MVLLAYLQLKFSFGKMQLYNLIFLFGITPHIIQIQTRESGDIKPHVLILFLILIEIKSPVKMITGLPISYK